MELNLSVLDLTKFTRLKYLLKGLREIGLDIADMLNPDRQPDHIIRNSDLGAILRANVFVRGRSWVKDEGFRVTETVETYDNGKNAREGSYVLGGYDDHLEGLAESSTSFESAPETEADDRAESPLEVPEGTLVIRVVWMADVADPGHEWLFSQPVGNLGRILRVTLATHGERLKANQQLLGRGGAQRASCIAKNLKLAADGKGSAGEALPELGLGVLELGKPFSMNAPVESATVDDDAAYSSAVAANPFGGRVHDDVYPVVNRTTEISSTAKGVIALETRDSKFQLAYSTANPGSLLQSMEHPWRGRQVKGPQNLESCCSGC